MATQRKRTGASMDAALGGSAKKARKKTVRLPGPSKAAITLLRRMNDGAVITARRTYPREWHYDLSGVEIAAAGSVTTLVAAGMISAGPTKSTDDELLYRITPLGRERLKSEPAIGHPKSTRLGGRMTSVADIERIERLPEEARRVLVEIAEEVIYAVGRRNQYVGKAEFTLSVQSFNEALQRRLKLL